MVTFSFYSFCHLFHHTIRLFPDDANDFITLYGIFVIMISQYGCPGDPAGRQFGRYGFPSLPDFIHSSIVSCKYHEVRLFGIKYFFDHISHYSVFLLIMSQVHIGKLCYLKFTIGIKADFIGSLLRLDKEAG